MYYILETSKAVNWNINVSRNNVADTTNRKDFDYIYIIYSHCITKDLLSVNNFNRATFYAYLLYKHVTFSSYKSKG